MRYSIQPREQKYIQGYCFMSYPKNFGDECG